MQFVWEAFYKYIQEINCAHFIDFCVNLFRRCHSPRGHQKSPEDKCVERYLCHWKYCVFGIKNYNIKKVFNLDDFSKNVFSIEILERKKHSMRDLQ